MNTPHIYVVTTEGDEEGKTERVLGYATGKPEHIRAFYDREKTRTLYLHETPVLHITPETVLTKRGLQGRKHDLEDKLRTVEKELRELTGAAA